MLTPQRVTILSIALRRVHNLRINVIPFPFLFFSFYSFLLPSITLFTLFVPERGNRLQDVT